MTPHVVLQLDPKTETPPFCFSQLKLAKERKKGDKIVNESQEKAYWRVYRPPPGFTTVVESSPVPTREQRVKLRSRTREHLTEEYEFLRNYAATSRAKVGVSVESLVDFSENIYAEFDACINAVVPSNPWISDDQTYWMLNSALYESAENVFLFTIKMSIPFF